jgi:hypothetical protein
MITDPKICKECKETKTEFKRNRHGNPSSLCTDCEKIRQSGYHHKQHASTPERKLAWALRTIKWKSQKNGIPFDIELKDFLPLPETCPALGTPMHYEGDRDSIPTFDRLVPNLGYVKGNVHLISHRANRMKSDATPEEIMNLANWLNQA